MARPRKTLPLLDRVAAQGDQRLFTRKTTPIEVVLADEHGDPLLILDADNVSVGGMFLRGTVPMRVGAHVLLMFTLPNHPILLQLTGEVVRVDRTAMADPQHASGLGIRFLEVEKTALEVISAWVQRSEE